MAKFLWHGSYSERGAKALVVEGGTKRRAGVEQAVTAMGGTLEAMYFAFGDDDYYAIVDLPDNVSGPAVSLATALAGAVRLKTVVLLTAQDLTFGLGTQARFRSRTRRVPHDGPGLPGRRRRRTRTSVVAIAARAIPPTTRRSPTLGPARQSLTGSSCVSAQIMSAPFSRP
jgi:uncharacterized protein with GYD domain